MTSAEVCEVLANLRRTGVVGGPIRFWLERPRIGYGPEMSIVYTINSLLLPNLQWAGMSHAHPGYVCLV